MLQKESCPGELGHGGRGGERAVRGGGLADLSCRPVLLPQFIRELILLKTLDSSPGKAEQQSALAGLTLNSTATNIDIQKAIRIIIDQGEKINRSNVN